jgi:hypothetical protein
VPDAWEDCRGPPTNPGLRAAGRAGQGLPAGSGRRGRAGRGRGERGGLSGGGRRLRVREEGVTVVGEERINDGKIRVDSRI